MDLKFVSYTPDLIHKTLLYGIFNFFSISTGPKDLSYQENTLKHLLLYTTLLMTGVKHF